NKYYFLTPVKIYFLAIQLPLHWPLVRKPINRLCNRLRPGSIYKTLFNKFFLFFTNGIGLCRNKKRGTAFRQQFHPLFIFTPWNFICKANTISIRFIKSFMLHHSKS